MALLFYILYIKYHFGIPGFIITGGSNAKVELYNPVSNQSCALADLPQWRRYHTLCNDVLCGGQWGGEGLTCLKWNGTTFSPASVTLREYRYGSMCWNPPGQGERVMLLGGEYHSSPSTTEILSEDVSGSSASWNLTHRAE